MIPENYDDEDDDEDDEEGNMPLKPTFSPMVAGDEPNEFTMYSLSEVTRKI